MPPLVIYADRAFTPLEEIADAVVVVDSGIITAVGPRRHVSAPVGARVVRAEGRTLAPGFVDVHIHGAGGHDVMEGDAAALEAAAATVARYGTTSLAATTVTASEDRTCRALEQIAQFIEAGSAEAGRSKQRPYAEYLGIHLEGPFISPAQRGVHPAEWIAPPSADALRRYAQAARGHAKLLTLAPELPGALEVVDTARQAGMRVGLGHTDATYAQARAAIERGASHAAHVFNAMRPFSHRETGVLGAVLTSPEVGAEVIADGVHVDDAALRLLVAAKGAAGTVLVSDGTAATGMPDGKYRLGPFEVTVTGGVCRNAEGRLAGSTLTLDRALRHMVGLGVPLGDALRMCTVNPARALGLHSRKGVLAPGADADFVLFNRELQVAGVFLRGIELS